MRHGYLLWGAVALLLFAWLSPNHYFPWVTFYSDISAFCSLFFLVFYVFLNKAVSISRCSLVVFAIALIPLVQYFFDVVFFWGDAFIAASYLAASAVAILIGRELYIFSNAAALRWGAWTFVVGGGLSVAIAVLQWLSLSNSVFIVEMPPGGRPFSNLAQPNNFSTLICLALVSLGFLYERSQVSRVGSAIIAFFLIVGLVLAQSRTSWVGAILLLCWWVFKARCCGVSFRARWVAAWVCFYALFILFFPVVNSLLYLPVVSLEERIGGLHRLDLWGQLIYAVFQGGIWGYGWNQVSVAQLMVSDIYSVPLLVEHSHNIILDILIWNGLLVGAFIVVGVGVWLGERIRVVSSVEGFYILQILGFLLLHSMLEFPLEYAFFLVPMCLFIGMGEAVENVSTHGVPSSVAVLCLGGALLSVYIVWGEYRVLEEDHRLMRFEQAGIGFRQEVGRAPDVIVLDQLRGFIRFARTDAVEGMTSEEIVRAKSVAYRYPYSPVLFRYALILAINGQPAQAVMELNRLKGLHGDSKFKEAVAELEKMRGKYPQLNMLDLKSMQ